MATATPPFAPTQQPDEDFSDFWTRYTAYLADLSLPFAGRERSCVVSQNAFLAAFAKSGAIVRTAEAIGISPWTVYHWITMDTHCFRHRIEKAREAWAEYLESIALARIEEPSGNRGSDVLLMGMLNANHPTKWRRDAVVIVQDSSREMLGELKKLTAQRMAQAVAVTPVEQTAEAQVTRALGPGVKGDASA